MDLDLAKLQEELAAVQLTSETRTCLSERNVVELILKLKSLNKIEVVHTLSGKEYLTPKRLKQEILLDVESRGGRARLDEIASSVNVDFSVVEAFTKQVVESNADLSFISPVEVLTTSYLDSICEEIDERLRDLGSITVGKIATDTSLPLNIIKTALEQRVGKQINAEYKNGTLYTASYSKLQLAKVRGLLSGATRPISVTDISAMLDIESSEMEKYVAEISLHGTIRAGSYIPNIFLQTQRKQTDSFFKQNGYFSFDMAKKLLISRDTAEEFVQQTYPDAISLDSCVVSNLLVQTFFSTVEECAVNGSYLDITTVLPSQFTDGDYAAILSKCKTVNSSNKTSKAVLFCSVYIVSKALLDQVKTKLNETAHEEAQHAHKSRPSGKSIMQERSSRLSASDTKRKKGKRKKKDEEDFDDYQDSGTGDEHLSRELKRVSNLEKLSSVIKEGIALLEEEEDDELLESLVEECLADFRSHFIANYEELGSSVLHGDATTRRKRQTFLESRFTCFYNEMLLYTKGFHKLSNECKEDEETVALEALYSYFVDNHCFQFAGLLAEHQCVQYSLEFVPIQGSSRMRKKRASRPGDNPHWTCKDSVSDAIARIPFEERMKKLQRLVNFLSSGPSHSRASNVVAEVEKAAKECGLVVRPPDKKTEKAIAQDHRSRLVEKVTSVSSNETVFSYASALVLQQCKYIVLPFVVKDDDPLKFFKPLRNITCSFLQPDRQLDMKTLLDGANMHQDVADRVREMAILKNPATG